MKNIKENKDSDERENRYINIPHSEIEIFKERAKEMIDYVSNYSENISEKKLFPQIKPGYMKTLIPSEAPIKPDHWESIKADIDNIIMPGIMQWNHPNFHSYFPTGNSYESLYGEILCNSLNNIGFTWSASPVSTELELAVIDWLAKMLHLPEEFLFKSEESRGLIYNSCSEATLVALFIARNKAIEAHFKDISEEDKYSTIGKLVGYYSDQGYLSAERAGILSMIKMKQVKSINRQMSGSVLKEMIDEDIKNGFIPFYCVATLGTTGSCAFDNLEEIGPICEKYNIWLHVDAAYAGAALICPEFRYLMKGIEYAMSFVFNPHDWLLVHFDCSVIWFRYGKYMMKYFATDAPYMETENLKNIIDLRHWQIGLGRKFRSLKLWFVLRIYGTEGLQKYIRNHVRLAHLFEQLISSDKRFEIVEKVTLGIVCFRLKGSNELNENLYSRIEQERKIHILTSKFNDTDTLYLRFAVCYQFATDEHIKFAYQSIINSID